MKINVCGLLVLILFVIGCKNETSEPASSPTTNAVIVGGTVTYDSIIVHPVGMPPPPVGYYLVDRHWVSQVTDTGSFVYLSRQLTPSYINRRIWVEGLDTIKSMGGSLGTTHYMLLKIDSLRLLN